MLSRSGRSLQTKEADSGPFEDPRRLCDRWPDYSIQRQKFRY